MVRRSKFRNEVLRNLRATFEICFEIRLLKIWVGASLRNQVPQNLRRSQGRSLGRSGASFPNQVPQNLGLTCQRERSQLSKSGSSKFGSHLSERAETAFQIRFLKIWVSLVRERRVEKKGSWLQILSFVRYSRSVIHQFCRADCH